MARIIPTCNCTCNTHADSAYHRTEQTTNSPHDETQPEASDQTPLLTDDNDNASTWSSSSSCATTLSTISSSSSNASDGSGFWNSDPEAQLEPDPSYTPTTTTTAPMAPMLQYDPYDPPTSFRTFLTSHRASFVLYFTILVLTIVPSYYQIISLPRELCLMIYTIWFNNLPMFAAGMVLRRAPPVVIVAVTLCFQWLLTVQTDNPLGPMGGG